MKDSLRSLFKKSDSIHSNQKNLTKRQVLSVSKPGKLPSASQWRQLPHTFSKKEKKIFRIAVAIFLLSLFSLGLWYVYTHRVDTPTIGGEYTEALIGEPQLINPLYTSSSDADTDLSRLVYSGLTKWTPSEGITNDLAESISVSEDGTVYTARILEDARFHDGEAVRARDILFTVTAIQNPAYRSPLIGQFTGVTMEQIDDATIAFTLEEPNAFFLHALSVGILPANIWGEIPAKNAPLASLNLQPIGSGPYKFEEFTKDKRGTIRSYTLKRNDDFYAEGALIETLNFKFYPDAESAISALENKNVEGVSFIPAEQEETIAQLRGLEVHSPFIPRSIGLYFNQENQEAFEKLEVRQAFAHTINKDAIIEEALGGKARTINSPILPDDFGYSDSINYLPINLEKASELLDEAGFDEISDDGFRVVEVENEEGETVDGPLTFTLTTAQNTEFVQVAETIASQFEQIGVKIDIETIDSDTFISGVVDTREFELLLTPTLMGSDQDPYIFWHSTEAISGPNIAQYKNRNVDELLDKGRSLVSEDERKEAYREFQQILADDIPAIYLYQSQYNYVITDKVKNIDMPHIRIPSDRFATIEEWYIKTKKRLK